jgi:hypothetical protein
MIKSLFFIVVIIGDNLFYRAIELFAPKRHIAPTADAGYAHVTSRAKHLEAIIAARMALF